MGATGINTGHQSPLQGLVTTNPSLQNAYNCPDPTFAGIVSRDSWVPATSGGDISSYAFQGRDNTNVFTPTGYQTPISQAQHFFMRQTTSAEVPTLEVSPITGPNFSPSIDTPTPARHFSGPRRALISNFQQPSMGISDVYPISPQSERRRSTSIPTSASPHNSLLTSPAMSTSQSPHNSESSTRHRVSVQRAQEPPRNAKDEIYCNHAECEADPPTFRRRSELNKHTDKHEQPYKCTESAFEKLQGFTYSGGLLRHQHEVHKKAGTTKATLFCPQPNCNRRLHSERKSQRAHSPTLYAPTSIRRPTISIKAETVGYKALMIASKGKGDLAAVSTLLKTGAKSVQRVRLDIHP